MAKKYHGFHNATNTVSATAPMYTQTNTTGVRTRLYDWICGSDATPADAASKFSFQRCTVNFGTPVAVTPTLLDPADPAAVALFSSPGGTAPTLTANAFMLQVAMNQRATFRWVAAPDGEIYSPAASGNGLALMSLVATATANYAWSHYWME